MQFLKFISPTIYIVGKKSVRFIGEAVMTHFPSNSNISGHSNIVPSPSFASYNIPPYVQLYKSLE